MVVLLLWPKTDSIWYMFTCGTLTYVLKLQWLVKMYTPKSNSWLRPWRPEVKLSVGVLVAVISRGLHFLELRLSQPPPTSLFVAAAKFTIVCSTYPSWPAILAVKRVYPLPGSGGRYIRAALYPKALVMWRHASDVSDYPILTWQLSQLSLPHDPK